MRKLLAPALLAAVGLAVSPFTAADGISFPLPPKFHDSVSQTLPPKFHDGILHPLPPK